AAISKAAHKTLKTVSEDIESLAFNRAIAHIHAFANVLQGQVSSSGASTSEDIRSALRESVEILIQILGPFMPHLAEECWSQIGGDGLVSAASWPEFEARLVVDDEIV